jgi:hypothetical protein
MDERKFFLDDKGEIQILLHKFVFLNGSLKTATAPSVEAHILTLRLELQKLL